MQNKPRLFLALALISGVLLVNTPATYAENKCCGPKQSAGTVGNQSAAPATTSSTGTSYGYYYAAPAYYYGAPAYYYGAPYNYSASSYAATQYSAYSAQQQSLLSLLPFITWGLGAAGPFVSPNDQQLLA